MPQAKSNLKAVPAAEKAVSKRGGQRKGGAKKAPEKPLALIPALKLRVFGPPKRKTGAKKAGEGFKTTMTFCMAVSVPAVALAATRMAGTCAGERMFVLGAVGVGLAVTMLLLSVGHVRDGVVYITGDSVRNATLLAWALDGFMLFSEAVHAFGPQSSLIQGVAMGFLVGCAVLSAALNWTAFRYSGEIKKLKVKISKQAHK